MSQYLEHITIENQRWDTIAWKYYRDVSKMSLLIESNPHAPITPNLPAGLKLRIPMIEQPQQSTYGLPPWKQ